MTAHRTVRPVSSDELARIFNEVDFSDELRGELVDPIEMLRARLREHHPMVALLRSPFPYIILSAVVSLYFIVEISRLAF